MAYQNAKINARKGYLTYPYVIILRRNLMQLSKQCVWLRPRVEVSRDIVSEHFFLWCQGTDLSSTEVVVVRGNH